MSAQQSFAALLALLVLCQTVPFCVCVGLRITCPNQQCYGDLDNTRELRHRAEMLRKLVEIVEARKMMDRMRIGEFKPAPPMTFEAGPTASSLCFCSPKTNTLTCPWNAMHPSQGQSCDDRR